VDEPLGSDGRRTDMPLPGDGTEPGRVITSTRVVPDAPAVKYGSGWSSLARPRWLLQQRLAGKPGPFRYP